MRKFDRKHVLSKLPFTPVPAMRRLDCQADPARKSHRSEHGMGFHAGNYHENRMIVHWFFICVHSNCKLMQWFKCKLIHNSFVNVHYNCDDSMIIELVTSVNSMILHYNCDHVHYNSHLWFFILEMMDGKWMGNWHGNYHKCGLWKMGNWDFMEKSTRNKYNISEILMNDVWSHGNHRKLKVKHRTCLKPPAMLCSSLRFLCEGMSTFNWYSFAIPIQLYDTINSLHDMSISSDIIPSNYYYMAGKL